MLVSIVSVVSVVPIPCTAERQIMNLLHSRFSAGCGALLIRGCLQVNHMSDYQNCFNILEVNAVLQTSGLLLSPDRLKLCGLLEETIGFQHSLSRNLRFVKDDYGYDNMAMCYNRCIFNTSYLYHAYKILKSEDFPVFFTVIRTAFESVPKLFYCMRHAEKAKHVFCCEFLYGKLEGRMDEGAERFCKSTKEPVDCENCKYVKRPNWFYEKVYTKGRQKKVKKKYGQYSLNTHPNFDPAYVRTRDDLEYGWDTGLGILTDLSLMNAFIMVNAVERGLTARGEYEPAKSFIECVLRNAGGGVRRGMEQLYPNRVEYTEMLPFTLPNID